MHFRRVVLTLGLLTVTVTSAAWALPPGFSVEQVHSSLSFPTALRFARDGRLFYTERSGRIMVFNHAFETTPTVWATVPVSTAGERGLVGLDLHPSFPDSPYVYVFHTNPSPLVARVARLEDSGGVGINYTIFFDNLSATFDFHIGGRLAFGPDDRLYVTHGDQTVGDPQSPTDLRGKILRLGPGGGAAPGNPFGAGNPVYAIGIRNAFGLCFDPVAGTGYFTDPGPSCDDELNLLTAGANYGWGQDFVCGADPPGAVAPMATFPNITPTGCCVYRGNGYPAHFDRNLFIGFFSSPGIWRAKLKSGSLNEVDTLESFLTSTTPVLDVTVGPDGYLWYCTSNSIARVVARGTVGVDADVPGALALVTTPNPFRVTVSFRIPSPAVDASLAIFDIHGRLVRNWRAPLRQLVEWDGRTDRGHPAPPGVYVARLSGRGIDHRRRFVRIAG